MTDTFFLPPDDPDLDKGYITGREYMNGVVTGVKTISSKMKTNVIFSGVGADKDGAATDGKNVYLPQQDPEAVMTHRQVAVGRGYGNHEALHQILTDMPLWHEWASKMTEEGRNWTKNMGNAIEDVRIEHGGLTLYPGIAKSIDKTVEAITRRAAEQFREKPELKSDMLSTLPLAVTWAGRIRMGYPSEALHTAFGHLDHAIQERANKIVDAIMGLETGVRGVGDVIQRKAFGGTKAALDLAELVSKEVAEEMREREVPTSPDDGDGETEGEPGDVPGPASEAGDDGDKPDEEEGVGSKPSGGTEFRDDDDLKPEHEDVETVDHGFDQVREMLSPEEEPSTGVIPHPLTTAYDEFFDAIGTHRKAYSKRDAFGYSARYKHRREMLGSRLATMRRKLEAALITRSRSEWEGSRTGRLDIRKRGVGIMRGDDKIFRKLTEADHLDTAVQLLIDCSGSMGCAKMEMAGDVTIALACALDGAGIPFEALGFWSDSPPSHIWETRGGHSYARYDIMRIPVFKGFEHAMRQRLAELGTIGTYARADNPDADAIRMVLPRLLARREQRKVLMVLSDGSPAFHTSLSRRDVYVDTRRAVTEAVDAGVDVVGIGILDNSVKEFYHDYVVVHDLDDLSKTVLDRLAKLLLGDRFHVDNSDLIDVA